MKTIAITNFYEIYYDEEKNRVYYKVKGYWKNTSDVPDYLKHIDDVLIYIKPRFTMLADTTELEPHPFDIKEIRKKAQIIAVQAGMVKCAQLVPADFVSALQFDHMTEVTHFITRKFLSATEAEAWLDEI